MPSSEVKYANWWSKLFFQKAFEQQFVIPIPPPRIVRAAFNLLEATVFRRDVSRIKIDRPIFIVGLPRSGTSVLYDLLCAHDQAAYVTNSINSFPESIVTIEKLRRALNLNISGERFLKDSIVSDFGSPSEPAIFWGKWTGRDLYSLAWNEKRIKDFSPEKIEEIRTDVRKMLYAFGADPSGKGARRRFICKYPVFQTELRMINDLFPDAYFIHIVRDGRETANSLLKLNRLVNEQIRKIKHPTCTHMIPYPRVSTLAGLIERYGADDIRTTAHIWQDSIEAVHSVKDSLSNFIEIRYEDLVADPTGQILSLMNRVALPRPSSSNDKFWDYLAGIGVMSHKNNYDRFDVVEEIAAPTLRKFGYLPASESRDRRSQVAVVPGSPDHAVDQIV